MLKRDQLKQGKSYHACCPKGHPIMGTYDLIPGCALVSSFEISDTGEIQLNWAGETEMYWDSADTQKDTNGEVLYMCGYCDDIPESELVFREDSGFRDSEEDK